ncbi:MAG: hypothetical protein WA865_17180, partial [Spirulinaceae cyanobacterium]
MIVGKDADNNEPFAIPQEEIEETPEIRTSQLKFTNREFYQRLPQKPLLLLGIGYFFLGILLGFHQAPWLTWLLTGFSSLLGVFNSSLTFFVPVIATFCVLSSTSMSIVTVVLGAVMALVFLGLLFSLDFDITKALEGGVWIGGLISGVLLLTDLFFNGINAFSSDEEIFAGAVPMGITLLVGIITITFGASAW